MRYIRLCVKGDLTLTNAKNDFTQGSILKKLALFMLPILGALVLQAAYGAVDLLVVGRFGSTSGLSAVSTGSQVLNLVTFVVIQFATAITILIARYLGEKRPERIGSVIGGGVIVFAAISIVLFFLMVVFAHPIAVLMQAPAEAVDLTTSYVRICGSGIFFIVAYNLMAAIFRGLGDSKSPLLFVLVACIVNIGGDLILVAGLHLDAAGAALAVTRKSCLSKFNIPVAVTIPNELVNFLNSNTKLKFFKVFVYFLSYCIELRNNPLVLCSKSVGKFVLNIIIVDIHMNITGSIPKLISKISASLNTLFRISDVISR